MRYGSVCSGIEAASQAWKPLGWEPAFFSEIEPFACAALKQHHPDVPNYGDMTKFKEWPDAAIDVLVGGTPCQSFSVAGLRGGLDDPRGNLMLTYAAIARRYRPKWLDWENVPGVLSSNGGRDFGSLLGILSGRAVEVPAEGWQNSGIVPGIKSAYGLAWRVLDAQYFGVPQRRRRVFVVGYLGDWRRAAAVIFERHSLQGHPAPRRETREVAAPDVASSLDGSGPRSSRVGDIRGQDNVVVRPSVDVCPSLNAGGNRTGGNRFPGADVDTSLSLSLPSISHCLNAGGMGRIDAESETLIPTNGCGFDVTHSLRADGFDASEDGTGRGTPLVPIAFDCKASGRNGFGVGGVSPTLRAMGHKDTHQNAGGQVAVMTLAIRGRGDSHNLETCTDGTANAVLTPNGGRAGIGVGAIAKGMQVRRLTPRECERLQGFPDDYTAIPFRGKLAADGPRYKALGNSMAVPVMAWIGERMQMVDAIK